MKTNFNIQKEIISHLKSSARVYQGYSKGIRFAATILVLLFIGMGNAWGADQLTYSHTFSVKPSTGNSVALSSVNWKIEATNLNGYQADYAGVQFGAKKSSGTFKLTSVNAWGEQSGTYKDYTTIKSVVLYLNTGATLSTYDVTIGGKRATRSGTVSKNSSCNRDYSKASKVTYTPITGGTTGVVVIDLGSTSNGAQYICRIEIVCEKASTTKTCVLHDGAGGSSTTNKIVGSDKLPAGAAVAGWEFQYWCTTSFADSDYGNHGTTYTGDGTVTTPDQANLYAVYYNSCTFRYSTSPTAGYHIVNMGPATTGGAGDDYFTASVGGSQKYCTIAEGTTVTLTSHQGSGSTFTGWHVTKTGDPTTEVTVASATAATTTFTMPAYNIDITANFCKDLSGQTLTVYEPDLTYNTTTKKWDATMTWSSVEGAEYYLVTVLDKATSTKVVSSQNVGNVTSYDVSGLIQDHAHTFAVQARTSCNDSKSTGTIDATPTCPALTATTVSYGTKTSTFIVVNWTAVSGADKYTLVVQKRNSADDGWESTPAARFDDLTVLTKTITGLTPNTKYRANVQAISDCGSTKATAGAAFTTLAQYTVHFDGNGATGGSVPSDAVKDAGSSYSLPGVGTLTNTGYTFGGWLEGSTSGTLRASGYSHTVNADITFYAKWTIQSYDVTFNMHDHGSAVAKQTIEYNGLVTEPSPAPSDADWKFGGWYKEAGYSNLWNFATDHVTAATTLHAKWTAKTYTNYRTTCSETYDIVLHDNNGGSHNGSAKVAANGKQLTSIVAPKRDGYSVEGYYKEAETSTQIATASGALQSDKTGYTDATGAWTKGDGATLYAKWIATNYTITYDGLEGASNSNPTSYNIATPTITLVAPGSREGYTFAGWTCGGSPITQIAVGSTGDKTITATWTANTYTVRFNANGGSGSMSNQNFTYGVAQNLTSNGFTAPDDKSFGGWTTNSDGTGDFYTNGQSVSNLTSVNGATVDLYAKWVDCDLYTMTLNVNGDTWKTVTQGSCGASIDLSGYQGVPSCDAKYTFVGWSESNSGNTTNPTITKTSSYEPESNTTLYAVYSYSAKMGTLVKSTTGFGGPSKSYIIAASGYNSAMGEVTTGTVDGVSISKDGDNCVVTGSDEPAEFYFEDAGSSKWFVYQPYIDSEDNYGYIYFKAPTGSSGKFSWYDEEDYKEWYIYDDDIKPYGYYDYEYIQTYMKSHATDALWTLSINGTTGVATLTAVDAGSNTRSWQYNNTASKFSTYTTSQKPIALYEYTTGTAYTTQPDMTVYTITKGVESNGTFTIAEGVACSGQAVAVSATPASGYAFSGWTSSTGGSFGNASSATTTFTPTANTTVTANFVAATPHDITWMVNGTAYTTGEPTNSMTAGTSFSTMTLPTAPANNTLNSACGAVANQFVGWSQTDMGFATGQSAPAKLFTNAAGAGTAYGLMGDADVTFYAVFAQDGSSNYMSRCANTYSIMLDKKEGTTDGTAVATEQGTSLNITLAPTYAGHSVEGYYAETGRTTKIADANGSLIANKSGYTDGSGKWINTTSPLTLYTNWTLNSHTLTWNLDGGSISAAGTPAGTIAYGTALVAPTVTKTGYTFNAWSPAVDATMPDNDVTYTATWTAKQYAITYKDKDDAAYSGDKTDGRPTGCPANHTYGSATDLPYGVKAGYRFDGWFTTSACTGDPITSIASDEEGPFTLYAKWTASHTFTFSKNGVVDGTLTLGQVEGGNVIMPNTTVDCGLWTTFEGWVIGDVAETTTEPATIYKPGDIYVAGSSNQEFKAVYSKHEGDATVYYEKVTSGPKSGTYVMVSYPRNDIYYIYTSYNASSYCNQSPVTISDNGTVSAANATSASAREVTVRAGNGANTGKFAIYDGTASKYLTGGAGSVGVNNDITFCWNLMDGSTKVNSKEQIPKAGAIHSTTNTTYLLQLRNHSTCDRFQMYANTQTDGTNPYDVYLYRKRVAGTTYYTTAPESCEVPTEITVSYNDNKANAGDQTISGMPSGTTLTFTDYPDFDTYTVGSAPTDPTGYHFTGWNTSAEGGGDSYDAGEDVTTFGYVETITLYAQWERVYTVTLYDNGVERTRLTQASAGANVTLPSGNNCTPGSAFTFVGWTDSPVQLNAEPVRPNIVSGAGEWGDDELTDDITLYSVYSKSVAGCDDFAAGVSGAYKMYYDGSTYATTAGSTGSYTGATSGTAEVFYIAYAPAHTGYTIRTSTGFVGWNYDGSELTKANATPYYWKISGSSSNWVITPEPSAYTKQFKSTDGSKFQLYAAATSGKLLLQKSAMTYYYNTASCGDNSITFHDGGGSISGTPTTPTGASWNSGAHILSGLEDCDKITEFPTASYDGWTFIGWSTEDYSNNGKHTTDYVEENASTDEPDGSGIYKTDGNPYVVRGGSIDMYPIFTRFPENEPFNTTSGGDYYIYYLEPGSNDGYGALVRQYAGEYDNVKRYGRTTSCAAATEFTFTKDGDVWHIYDKTKGKYVTGKTSDDWLVLASDLSGSYDDWTITIRSGNQFDATCGVGGGRQLSFSTAANYFMNYELAATPGYPPVYLGTCTERIFSSEPNPTPTVDLTGEPMVTSSKGQTVRAAIPMTLSASHITGTSPLKVTITGTNLKFATSAAVNTDPATSLEVAVDGSGKIDPTTIYVYYTPTEDEDGIENITVTAVATKWGPTEIKRTTGIVHARHLPEDFVIATKLGDKWYALPANCTTNSSSTEGMLIEVDDVNDPTAATAAPASTKYGLRNVAPKTRKAGNGERMVFTERISTATADNQMTLYNGSSTNIQVNAMYTTYKDNDTEETREKYEWTPETSDFKDYLLTSASASRTLSMNTSGVFGSLTKDKAYSGQVRLLPATFYTPADMQVVEWKANSVVVMYTGSGVTATTKVGTNSESSAQTLTTAKVDHGVFELTTNQALTSNANTQLLITIKNGSSAVVGKTALVIPAIINTNNKTADYVVSGADAAERIAKAAATDVVILDGAVLSAVATKYTYKNITVYPGGKLVIGSDKQLGMASLTLRGGSSWGAASYEHKYPQFVVNNATDGAYSNTAVKINYDYVTTKAQYYTFVLPYTGNTSTIKYPVDIYGKNLDSGSQASFEFQYYDGAARAAGGTGWATLAEPADLVAGRGYTFLGMPRKVDAYDGTDNSHSNTRQTYGIHRIPMSVSASTVQSGETNSSPGKSTPISVTLADKNNASGWVLVGNPFMGDVTGLSNEDIQVGELVHTSTVPWDGKWEWDDTNPSTGVRYVVIPYNSGTDYHSEMAEDAELPAFKNFFVQIKNGSATSLVIPASSRNDAGLAPARYVAQEVKDIRLAVDLVSDTKSDKVDFLINDTYSAAYDDDADFTKMMNGTNFNLYGVYPGDNLSFIAVDKTTAAGSIAIGYQVPAAGEYTLQLSERPYVMSDYVETLLVTDHEVDPEVTTDLLENPYTFTVTKAETNDTRFTVSIKLKENQDTPTDIDIINGGGDLDGEKPIKFIYHDKMYILRNGVLYDATGKRVKEINK